MKVFSISSREVLTLKDGGEVALDWKEENTSPSSPIVLLLPGLTGTSQTEYAKALAISASKAGIRFVVFNYRGLGGMQLKVSFFFYAVIKFFLRKSYSESIITVFLVFTLVFLIN